MAAHRQHRQEEINTRLSELIQKGDYLTRLEMASCRRQLSMSDKPHPSLARVISDHHLLPRTILARLVAMAAESELICPQCKEHLLASYIQSPEDFLCPLCGAELALDLEHIVHHSLSGESPPLPDEAPSSISEGTNLGDVVLKEVLGQGGMSSVYLGYQPKLDRKVAVKVLASHLSQHPQFVTRFKREAQLASQLSHQNLVQVYGIGEYRGEWFIIMEFVEGDVLEDMVFYVPAPSLDKILAIFIQVCQGLHVAHKKHVLHRDIKPANIFLDRQGRARLGDFGLARGTYQASITQEGFMVGTLEYMSPEQIQGTPLDHRTDLYSLGVSLYECVVGFRPFRQSLSLKLMKQHLHSAIIFPKETLDAIPRRLVRIIEKLMAKAPQDRYNSAEEVAQALEEIRQHPGDNDLQKPLPRPLVMDETPPPLSEIKKAVSAITRWTERESIGRDLAIFVILVILTLALLIWRQSLLG